MKLKKINIKVKTKFWLKTSLITTTLFTLSSCINLDVGNIKNEIEEKQNVLSKELKENRKETEKVYNEYYEWWRQYQDPNLNKLITLTLQNNKDYKVAALNANKVFYNAKIIGSDLLPSFNSTLGSSVSKNLDSGISNINHSASLNVSYTLDLWNKIKESKNGAEWSYNASIYDLEATKSTLINAITNYYYQLSYLNEVIKTNKKNINHYQQIYNIQKNKFKLGVIEKVEIEQAKSQLINTKQQLNNNELAKKQIENNLKKLMNLTPKENLYSLIKIKEFNQIKTIEPNLNLPLKIIANRADVKSKEANLKAKLHEVNADLKGLYPTITLGASLSIQDKKIDNVLSMPFTGGNISINLPFLNYHKMKWNIKSSEEDYNIALLNLEKSLNNALNELDLNYFNYQNAITNQKLQSKKLEQEKSISKYYKIRYESGISEFKDYLNALNSEQNSKLNLLNSKLNTINQINAIYASIN